MGESFRQRQERARRQFLNHLDDLGWGVVTDYVNWTSPMTVRCAADHEHDIVPKRFYGRCPECNPVRNAPPTPGFGVGPNANPGSDRRMWH